MFTVEEITLLESYKKETLKETLKEIHSNYQYQEDHEIIKLIDGLLLKLDKISENDFQSIDFSLSLLNEPDFE